MMQTEWPYRFYVDRRRGGEERWSLGPPRDALMRIPDDLLTCPIFIGGRGTSGELHYRGTAFMITLSTKDNRVGPMVLVTARHNILNAEATYNNLWVRVNTDDGGARDIEITTSWVYPDNPASDIAAIPFWPSIEGWAALPIPTAWFVTPEVVQTRGVGIGEELITMGLFASHVGRTRNLPIVRSGNIAAMPEEPLVDGASGEEYYAYLAEVRSIGGLSGSPVFAVLNPYSRIRGGGEPEDVSGRRIYLLGLIRGHWDRAAETDFGGVERDQLNTGIAIVTPITEVFPLLKQEVFVEYRKRITVAGSDEPTDD